MKLQDLDYLESLAVNRQISGGAGVYVEGDVYAGYGAGAANAIASAVGPNTDTLANTKVVATLRPNYGMTQSTAKAKATAIGPGFSGSASYFGNSSFVGTDSGGMTSTFTTTTARVR
jgi:hypothetical protein